MEGTGKGVLEFICGGVFFGKTSTELNVMDVGVKMEFWPPASLMQISELIRAPIPSSLWWHWDKLGKLNCFKNKGVRNSDPPAQHLLPLHRQLGAQMLLCWVLRMSKYPSPGITGLG